MPQTTEAWIYAAVTGLMLGQLAHSDTNQILSMSLMAFGVTEAR